MLIIAPLVSLSHPSRLNADGTLDSGFQNGISGADSAIHSIAIQDDGKLLIGGGFGTVHGIRRSGIARLNADGLVDSGYQNGLSGIGGYLTFGQSVNSIAVQSDGKALIGGDFTTVNGESRNGIAR